MPYIAPEVITEAKRMDLLTYLRTYEPGELVRYSGKLLFISLLSLILSSNAFKTPNEVFGSVLSKYTAR